jgi:hypothetical protein
LSSVIAVVLGFRLCLDNSTLPKITAVATSGPASARLSAVAPAGPSAASYTTTRGTTILIFICCGKNNSEFAVSIFIYFPTKSRLDVLLGDRV